MNPETSGVALKLEKPSENPPKFRNSSRKSEGGTPEFEGMSELEVSAMRPNKAGSRVMSNAENSAPETFCARKGVAVLSPARLPISETKSRPLRKLNAESGMG